MLRTLAVAGYRSLRSLTLPLAPLTVITGANGAGKSSVYRALRLLADCGQGRVIGSLAREGGLQSALWAGPESLSAARRGAPIHGTLRHGPVSLLLGFASDNFGYLVDLGLPVAMRCAFDHDPEIKREMIFTGPLLRPAATLVQRKRALVQVRAGRDWRTVTETLPTHRSVLTELADPDATPELAALRHQIRSWRFYDGFRVDAAAPARLPQVGTRTPMLADDGADLAAAVQTIKEAGGTALDRAIADAFAGARLEVEITDRLFDVSLHQRGMLRPLRAAELSDGTLRYLLWATALLTVDPPPLMVLNEPETSLHPDLLAPLARLIRTVATRTQVIVVSHARALIDQLGVRPVGADDATDDTATDDTAADTAGPDARSGLELELVKDLGETRAPALGMITTPPWAWGSR